MSFLSSSLNHIGVKVGNIMHGTLLALTKFLYFQTQLMSGLALQKFSAASQDQFPTTDLLSQYDIITNMGAPHEAKTFILLNEHDQLDQHDAYLALISDIAHDGDRLFFEGLNRDITYDCSEICLTAKGDVLNYDKMAVLKNDWEEKHPRCAINFDFKQKIICEGWEDSASYHAALQVAQKFDQYLLEIHALEEGQQLLLETLNDLNLGCNKVTLQALKDISIFLKNAIAAHPTLTDFQKTIDHAHETKKIDRTALKNSLTTYGHLMSTLYFEKLDVLESYQQQYFDPIVLKNRNAKGIIKTLQQYKYAKERSILFVGSLHLVPDDTTDLQKISKNDPQYALRNYLEEEPHAILLPRGKKS